MDHRDADVRIGVFERLLAFLNRLDAAHVQYALGHTRPESVMVDISLPGWRWEVEFMLDGSTSWDWWDCPRSGVALVGGQPYYFNSQFSEELDDYTGQFRLWPVPDDELADELEAWRMWAAWRDAYDSGLRPPPFPGDPVPAALERVRRRRQRQPPPDARMAIPEWRLDPDRRFSGRIPAHMVCWTFVG